MAAWKPMDAIEGSICGFLTIIIQQSTSQKNACLHGEESYLSCGTPNTNAPHVLEILNTDLYK